MGAFAQLVVDGLAMGAVYGALALAIVLVHQSTGVVNFAQGGLAVLSGYFAYTFLGLNVPLLLAILLSVAISFIMGALIERFIIRRFEGGDMHTTVVVTVGLLTLATGIAGWLWSYNNLRLPSLFPPDFFRVLGVSISWRSFGTFIVIIAIMVLLQLLFQKTRIGLALRAVADNPRSAAFSGLPVERLLMVGWGLAAALGAVAGVLVAPRLTLTPGMMDGPLVYALAAVILGGISSPVGVVVAASLIGILENLAAVYLPFIGHDLKIAVPFLLLFAVLLIRPEGLFGRKSVERV
ncbi:MAG TPA: branched-chain amino acid ABC transporter permease [Enteractinococcus helveticum]|uniref:Branched-chain amino acid ABC transporter permease n=1 Tax=Enteractinococcus helveticum TaxID=1837282 RepID=A0A921K8E1_9MICC|nr:branched-chain amino acid ABC transporter permease [Enteractinococcus helveticum]HJF15473.1 branched-chain amino acid ABC transporter permease [Enteractinococcus helveticum]